MALPVDADALIPDGLLPVSLACLDASAACLFLLFTRLWLSED